MTEPELRQQIDLEIALRLDEAEEKIAYLSAGCMKLSRDELINRITAVGPERWRAGSWLTQRLADERERVLALPEVAAALRLKAEVDVLRGQCAAAEADASRLAAELWLHQLHDSVDLLSPDSALVAHAAAVAERTEA